MSRADFGGCDAVLGERAGQPLLRRRQARALRNAAAGRDFEARAAVRCIGQQRGVELWPGGGEIAGDIGEAGDRRRLVAGETELLPFVQNQCEVDELCDEQRDPEQPGDLRRKAARAQVGQSDAHIRRTSAASM
jgi:hypothetical protein